MATTTARVSPETLNITLGGRFTLDGTASVAADGGDLAYAWSFARVPLGSAVAADGLTLLNDEGTRVSFVPDRTGPYLIQLTVTDGDSETATSFAAILVQAGIASADQTDTPDGSFFYKVIGDAWSRVENREMFSTLWSGYIQLVAADLVRAYQADYNKSIQTIQELEQRRWLPAHPGLDLSAEAFIGYWGPVQQGTGAFTTDPRTSGLGFAITATEWLFATGGTMSGATQLSVLSGANAGTYDIRRTNSDRSGYVLASTTPLPSPTSERTLTAADGILYRLASTLISGGTDFTAEGVVAGDVVRVEGASDAGYYTVLGVSGTQLTLDRPMTRTRTRVTFSVYHPVAVQVLATAADLTDVVYLPATEADLTVYQGSPLEGEATLLNAYEIEVERRHTLAAAVGRSITLTGGENGGRSFGLAALTSGQTGYLVTSPFSGTFPQTVRYRISAVSQITDRALVVDGCAYRIRSARYDDTFTPTDLGGPGPQWAVSLEGPPFPTNRTGLSWVMAHTLRFPGLDLDALGVRAGDVLDMMVQRSDRRRTAALRCQVLGAYADRLVLAAGTTGYDTLTDAEVSAFAKDFGLPTALLSALSIELASRSLLYRYGNLPIDATTLLSLRDLFGAYLRPGWLIRNTCIPLDDAVRSIPMLTEFVRPPDSEEVEDGYVYVAPDGTVMRATRAPVLLIENEAFTVDAEDGLRGSRAETAVDSAFVTLPYAALTSRDVHPGDVLVLESGLDFGTYYIRSVVSDNVVELTVPLRFARTQVKYRVRRYQEGSYARMAPGTFSPTAPAPRYLWAPTTYLSSDAAVEANFGELVNLTSAQLDAYGVSQVTYRDAVAALMYVWATGPTLSNVALGSSILLGLPITDTLSRLVEIDPAYRSDAGRILLEEVLPEGTPTGVYRSVLYASNADESHYTLFAGLAINPDTGSEYAVGDVVPAYRTLVRAVYVRDGVKEPVWGSLAPLDRLHRWEVQVDASQIDSRDLPLVADFLNAVRPIYTLPDLSLVLYLVDDVAIEVVVDLAGTLYLYDDPSTGLEATSMLDDDNGSSLSLRHLDLGPLATRVLFEGYDLVTTSGSTTISSVRGGFVLPLETGANDAFPTPVKTLGARLVRGAEPWMAGDLFLIRSGTNQGVYEVAEVVDDTSLVLQQVGGSESLHAAAAPWSRDPATLDTAEAQRFSIVRVQGNPLVAGAAIPTEATGLITDSEANFILDGVQPGDELVCVAGPSKGRYAILEVLRTDPEKQDSTQIIVEYIFPDSAEITYLVERPALVQNPVYTCAATTSTGSPLVQVTDALLSPLRTGDNVRLVGYPEDERVFRLLDVISDDTLYLWPTPAYSSTCTLLVTRDLRDAPVDSDTLLEPLWAEETLTLELTPQIEFVATTDVEITQGEPTTFTSATENFETLLVQTGDRVEVGTARGGAYIITSVSGMSFTVDTLVPSGTLVPVRIIRAVEEFDVSADVVTSLTGVDYEALGVCPGDMFIPDGLETFVIADVTGDTFRTTRTVGTFTTKGRICRRQVTG